MPHTVDNVGNDEFCSARLGIAGSFVFNSSKLPKQVILHIISDSLFG